jgi:hypothetical protein
MPADQNSERSAPVSRAFQRKISSFDRGEDRHPHCNAWLRSMPSTTSKSILAAVLATCALLASGRASAQFGGATVGTGTGGVSGSLSASSFTVNFESWNGSQWVQMTSTTQQYFFNQARCLCGQDQNAEFRVAIQAGSGVSQTVTNLLGTTLENGGQGLAYLFVGSSNNDCLTTADNGVFSSGYCTNLLAPTGPFPGPPFTMAAVIQNNVWESNAIPVARLFGAINGCEPKQQSCDSTTYCGTQSTPVNIQFWAQTNAGNAPDFDPGPTASVTVVGTVPYAPTMGTVEGGNEALIVNWNWPLGISLSTDTNLGGVQLFCQRGENNQVYKTGTFGAAYTTASSVCPKTIPATTGTSITSLDPRYLCSGLIPPTTTSHRITGLQNGIPYGVGVAAVDKYGNISAISGPVYGTPIPTVDFYSEYRNSGGTAQGGYCTLDRWHARPGALAICCLAGLGLILVLRKRGNGRRRGGPGSGTLILVFTTSALAASQVQAQSIYHDNSFIDEHASDVWNGTPREFAIEARFGLYTPNVDSEISGSPKPNAFIFGNEKRPMFQMEFDWEILQEFGTLAVAGAIGYYKENASACKKIELAATGLCVRSGDNTSLRLIPLAALLVYRMDEAARQWKIPLVPYGKIGLNYTFWTVNDGNGNVPYYAGGGRGQGGTAGWQAAVGMSLLLDFLDPSAARGFDADSGVNHTYAFFELDHIDGSGLGRKNVLHVGDNTWFTGLMFEF